MTDTIGGLGPAIADIAHTGGDQSRSTSYARSGKISKWHHAQLEYGSAPTSAVVTSGAGAVRQADSVTVPVPAASDGFAYVTYGDNSVSVIPVTPGGAWVLPFATYKRISFQA